MSNPEIHSNVQFSEELISSVGQKLFGSTHKVCVQDLVPSRCEAVY